MTKGFSLIEMMATMAIVSIMASIGIPSFNKFIERQHLASDINSVIRIANLARTEAIKKRVNISLCGRAADLSCNKDWKSIDIRMPESVTPIHSHKLSANYHSAIWSSFQRKPSLTFNPKGFSIHVNGTLYLCHAQFPELHRAIRFSKSGKATTVKDPKVFNERCN